MNAPGATITLDTAAKVAVANKWVDVARPLIREYLALGEGVDRLLRASFSAEDSLAADACREAEGHLYAARKHIRTEIENIRDRYVADEAIPWVIGIDPDEDDANIEHNDTLEAEVISVHEALRREASR